MPSPTEDTAREDRLNTLNGVAPDADKAADAAQVEDHADPDHPEHAAKKREDELQDEALEESFPASDPPSAKHIT